MPNLFQYYGKGEEKAFDHFFRLYYKALCYFALQYVKDQPVAEDIVQEGFVQLWNNREKISSEAHLRNYLYQAIYHLCLDQLQRKKRGSRNLKELATIADSLQTDFSQEIIKTETLRQLQLGIESLPARCRKIFYKLYLEGKTPKQVATELSLTISTVNSQKARGIKLLKLKLSRHFILLLLLLFLFRS